MVKVIYGDGSSSYEEIIDILNEVVMDEEVRDFVSSGYEPIVLPDGTKVGMGDVVYAVQEDKWELYYNDYLKYMEDYIIEELDYCGEYEAYGLTFVDEDFVEEG